ncbi:Spy/CpxP family protein refolding chaperone [Ideonella livida]|uniref:Periplasmic heavy metal sensor n=1 Tax=Ideonella livida TaxID=2707176 RepID=A0A7C9PHS2_9BURK|nr:Spy/CpxP family protein refolding chaperone [Ideonella livida]NDY92313.1 hypothetical protein [Ideonella livida]
MSRWFKPWIRRSLIAATALTVTLGLGACGHRPYGHGPMSEGEWVAASAKMVDRIGSRLDLDATQRQHLQALADTLRAQRAQVAGEPGSGRREVQALFAGERFDLAGAQSLVQRKTSAVQTASPPVLQALATFYDSLKPAQQAKVREFLARERGHGWRG